MSRSLDCGIQGGNRGGEARGEEGRGIREWMVLPQVLEDICSELRAVLVTSSESSVRSLTGRTPGREFGLSDSARWATFDKN